MFGLTYIDFDIVCFCIFSDNHTGIYFFAGTDEQHTAFLGTEQSVSYRFACLKCDQRALLTVSDVSLVRSIAVKCSIDDTISFCIC